MEGVSNKSLKLNTNHWLEQMAEPESQDQIDEAEAAMLAAFENSGESDESLHDAEAEMLAAFEAESNSQQAPGESQDETLERVLKMRLPLIAVLAEKEMSLSEVLSLKRDGIITFQKLNNEPLDFFVNDRKIGQGKAIKIGEQFGLWIDEIQGVKERLEEIA